MDFSVVIGGFSGGFIGGFIRGFIGGLLLKGLFACFKINIIKNIKI